MESNMKSDGITKDNKNIGEKEFSDGSQHFPWHKHMTSHPLEVSQYCLLF